jgi:hypothetical protein
MQGTYFDLFLGVFLWTIVMLIPLLISYFKTDNPVVSLFLLTTLYPNMLSYLTRNGRFWVTHTVLYIASVAALAVGLFLYFVLKPKSDFVTYGIPLFIFVLAMGGASTIFNMYNSNVLSY